MLWFLLGRMISGKGGLTIFRKSWIKKDLKIRPKFEEIDDLPVKVDSLYINEIKVAIKSLKNDKAAGMDNVFAGLWKSCLTRFGCRRRSQKSGCKASLS